jgi:hypothetical protein
MERLRIPVVADAAVGTDCAVVSGVDEVVDRFAGCTSIDPVGSLDRVMDQQTEEEVGTVAEGKANIRFAELEMRIYYRIRTADTAVEACIADVGIDVVAVPAHAEQNMLVDHLEYVHIARLLERACLASPLAFLDISTNHVSIGRELTLLGMFLFRVSL